MTFLNVLLLGGIGAAVIPLVLHLLFRKKRRLEWGAMYLLQACIKKQRKKILWKYLSLLLTRMFILILLAFCLARPIIEALTGRSLIAKENTSLVVILDNSYSMDYQEGPKSNLEKARGIVKQLLGKLEKGDEAAIILTSLEAHSPTSGPTFDIPGLQKELEKVKTEFAKAEFLNAFQLAEDFLNRSHNSSKELFVVTDFQKNQWEKESLLREAISKLTKNSKTKPYVAFINCGVSQPENISVQAISLNRFIVGKNQEVQISTRIANHGNKRYDNLKVNLEINGKHISQELVNLSPQGSSLVSFSYGFKEKGSYCINIDVETPLPLKADDNMSYSVDVWDELPVLVVDGAPSQVLLKGESDFLVIALSPSAEEKENVIRQMVIEPKQMSEINLTDFKVIILANVGEINSEGTDKLKSFLEGGGGILFFLGDKVNSKAYNELLYRGGEGLLPAGLETIEKEAKFIRIQPPSYNHPALDIFSFQEGMAMERAHIYQWYRLKVEKGKESSGLKTVPLAVYENSAPFLLERAFSQGRVVLCSTACDADWSDLPLRAFYLPLIQQLVTYLACQGVSRKNLEIGDSISETFPKESKSKTATLIRPEGAEEVKIIKDSSGSRVFLKDLRKPGLYTLLPAGDQKIYYVVHTDRNESDLEAVGPERLKKISADFSIPVTKNWASLKRQIYRWESSGEIWKTVLFMVIGLLFLELYLEQKFYM